MNIKKALSALVSVIAEEAAKNEPFKAGLERALYGDLNMPNKRQEPARNESPRKRGRRTPAVLDPVELARQGENVLRSRISAFDLEQLRDIVAQYGMDPGKLVMKWKDSKRVIDKIVELALVRATKGDAFRQD